MIKAVIYCGVSHALRVCCCFVNTGDDGSWANVWSQSTSWSRDERWKNTPPFESPLQTKREEDCIWQQLLLNQAAQEKGNRCIETMTLIWILSPIFSTCWVSAFFIFLILFLGSGETRKEPLSFFFTTRVHNHTQPRHTQPHLSSLKALTFCRFKLSAVSRQKHDLEKNFEKMLPNQEKDS